MSENPVILDEFPQHLGRPRVYPWNEWTDGKTRALIQGVHFHSTVESFRTLVHRTAKAEGLKAQTSNKPAGSKMLVVRFYRED